MLWALASALPWLLPGRANPWPTFYAEALAAAVLLPVGLWAFAMPADRGARSALGQGVGVDAAVIGLLVIALVPLLQASAGMLVFAAEAWVASLYLAAMATAVAAAQRAERLVPGRLADALFAGLALAAAASTAIAIAQWLRIDTAGLLIAPPIAGGRPAANVGQPNNLATLLAWGVVAAWWLQRRGRLDGRLALALAAWLLFGIALTQSRTGWVAVALIVAVAWSARGVLDSRRHLYWLLALAAGFVLAVLLLGSDLAGGPAQGARSLDQQLSSGKRPDIWRLALAGILERPWLGWGWNQGTLAHSALADAFPTLQVAVGPAHNIALDLLLWVGVPLGLAILVGVACWLRQQLGGVMTAERTLLLLALAVFGAHAMLELPHLYAFFLLPAAVMAGTLLATRPAPWFVDLPRVVPVGVVVVLGLLLAAAVVDYGRIEQFYMSQRLRDARIGSSAPAPTPEVHLLAGVRSALLTIRTDPQPGMTPEAISDLDRAARRYPTARTQFKSAQAYALNGRQEEARAVWRRLFAMHPRHESEAALAVWRELAAMRFPEMAAVEPLAPR